jgi:DNA primase
VGVQNRNLVRGALPRFRFPQDSQCGIYNLPVLNRLRPSDELFITEGCSDCWAMLSAGHKAIAIPSATLLSKKDAELLLSLSSSLSLTFHMFPDRDAPGERLFLQLKEVLPGLVHHQLPPECKDYSELYLLRKRTSNPP